MSVCALVWQFGQIHRQLFFLWYFGLFCFGVFLILVKFEHLFWQQYSIREATNIKGFLISNGLIVGGDRKSKLLISYQKSSDPKIEKKRNETAESSTERWNPQQNYTELYSSLIQLLSTNNVLHVAFFTFHLLFYWVIDGYTHFLILLSAWHCDKTVKSVIHVECKTILRSLLEGNVCPCVWIQNPWTLVYQ